MRPRSHEGAALRQHRWRTGVDPGQRRLAGPVRSKKAGAAPGGVGSREDRIILPQTLVHWSAAVALFDTGRRSQR